MTMPSTLKRRATEPDTTEEDELDIMARSSPVAIVQSQTTGGRTLRARRSTANIITLSSKVKRERTLSESTIENHEEAPMGKKRKMEDKKAVCWQLLITRLACLSRWFQITIVINTKRASLDVARRRWLHKHKGLFLPLLPSTSAFDHVGKDLEKSADKTPYVPLHELDEQPKLVENGTMKDYQVGRCCPVNARGR